MDDEINEEFVNNTLGGLALLYLEEDPDSLDKEYLKELWRRTRIIGGITIKADGSLEESRGYDILKEYVKQHGF